MQEGRVEGRRGGAAALAWVRWLSVRPLHFL